MDIFSKVQEYKNNSLTRKMTLFSFLEKLNLNEEEFSINDYITDNVLTLEKNDNPNYVYWVEGGLSWYYWYYKHFDIGSTEDKFDTAISMIIANLKFHYIFNDYNIWYAKIAKIQKLIDNLNTILYEKGIICKIECTNFDYDPANIGQFASYQSNSKKNPFYNVKLVFESYNGTLEMEGGSRKPSNIRNKFKVAFKRYGEQRKSLVSQANEELKQDLLNLKSFKDKIDNFTFNQSSVRLLKDKILVEFTLEYYHRSKSMDKPFNISMFKDFYIYKQDKRPVNIEPVQLFPALYKRKMLNRLNYIGLITFSLLNTSKAETKIEPESGINVDNIRQKLFIDKFQNLTLNEFDDLKKELAVIYERIYKSNAMDSYIYESHKNLMIVPILEIASSYYNMLNSKYLNYNFFFSDRIANVKYEIVYNYYNKFVDFIDRYFMVLFRPVVNAFVREINNELFEKHGIKLFIAGGDSMRRYNYNSSFTADIDTKLHYANAVSDKTKPGVIQSKDEINKSINNIVIKHIVLLRNFFEENRTNILSEFISAKQPKQGFDVFQCLNEDSTIEVKIDILDDNLQFRTRKIDKNETMPVDLYSIDFRYTVKLTDYATPNTFRKNLNYKRQVALLDIVLGDDKKFNNDDLNEEDGVAFASKNFLLKDIETTYDNETMALGRISNGKVEKDKIRYTEIRDNSIPLFVDVNMMYDLSKSVDEFFKLQQFTSYMRELFETIVNDSKLYDIFKKIRERNEYLSLTRDDFNYIMTLDLNIINKITSTFPYLGIIFREIWNSDIASRELKERNDQIQSLIAGNTKLEETFNKIKNKERLTIHDFFTLNDNCSLIEGNKEIFPKLAELTKDILEFKVNLPYEQLNIYNPAYHSYSVANINDTNNKFYVVFAVLCNENLNNNDEDSTFKHVVSYSQNVVNRLYEKITSNNMNDDLLKQLNIQKQCFIPVGRASASKSKSTMPVVVQQKTQAQLDAEAKEKKERLKAKKEEEKRLAELKKIEEEERKKAQSSARASRASRRQ